MPCYLVERTAAEPLTLPDLTGDPHARQAFLVNNGQAGVIWLGSYLTADGRRSFCLYQAPHPAAIRLAAQRNRLPIDRISEIRRLDAGPTEPLAAIGDPPSR
jgi:hypothetical protein